MNRKIGLALGVVAFFVTPAFAASNCEPIITAADIEAACGVKPKALNKPTAKSGAGGTSICINDIPLMGGGDGIGILVQYARQADSTKAQGQFKSATEGEAVKSLGDEAKFTELAQGAAPQRTLAVRKGNGVLEITHKWGKGKPACSKEQLAKLAKSILGRVK